MFPELHVDAYANPDDWRVLRTLAGYRLLLVVLLLGLHLFGYSTYLFDRVETAQFFLVVLSYTLTALLLLPATLLRIPALQLQAHLAFIVDTIAIVALMYSAHGVSSGLGVLLITPAVGSSLVLPPRLSLMHAALGTFTLFGAEFWRQSLGVSGTSEFTTAGLLGLMLFATALGGGAVAQRARKSEALAARVGSDLASLSRLNERIVESMDTPVMVVDEDRRLRMLNAAAKRLLLRDVGNTEGRAVAELMPALDDALRAWEKNPNLQREPLFLRADGPELLPRFTRLGFSVWAPVLVLLEDAAHVREQAQQLKLAALGRLSAGIAHEIRNPLSAIHHASQLLAESAHMTPDDQRFLNMIQRHSVRIDKIVTDVLRLSRRNTAFPQSLALKDVLEYSLALFREGGGGGLIEIEPIAESLLIRFDPEHFHQILHNLWRNSFEHGQHADGNPVRVQLSAGRLNPGQRPYLDIVDNGRGIPLDQQDKVFEPFFTTAHQGTGLGLYLSRELCEYNQARLLHVPRTEGTQFRMIFAAG
jgi:two-component system, NtrC family, sensor histidine kinase PilS